MREPARLSDAELESTLRDIGSRVAYPVMPNLASRVRARLTERERPRRPWLLALAPALVTLLVIAVGATAVETVRLRGIDVFRVPEVSAPPRVPLDLGERTSLQAVHGLVGVRTSSDPLLAIPDEVYVRRGPAGTHVAFAYGPRPSLAAGTTGYGALVVQHAGTIEAPLIGKAVGPGSRMEQLTIDGAPAIWIEGDPHFFFYRDAAGAIREESLRLAGNTLLWQRDRTLLRLEAQVSRTRAMELAASFR